MEGTNKETYEGWSILELMGHRKLGGYVKEQEIAGHGFLRIDIPGPDGTVVATQFYSPASVYAMTPTTEPIAKAMATRYQPEPVQRWELPAPREEYPREHAPYRYPEADRDDDDHDPAEIEDDTEPPGGW